MVYGRSVAWITLRRRSSSGSRPTATRGDVHHLLACERLHHPRAAVRAPAGGVRVRGARRELQLRDAVRAREDHRDEADRTAAGGGERAHVLGQRGTGTEDAAVGVEGHAHGHAVLAGVLVGQQILAAILDPLDGTAEDPPGDHDGELVGQHEHLLAEAATDIVHDHPNVVLGDAEGASEEAPHAVRSLGRDPHREALGRPVPPRDDAPRLHRHAEVAVLVERLGDHMGGVGEDLVELGVVDRRHDARLVAVELTVDQRCSLGEGGVDPDDRRLGVDLDLDELGRVLGDVARYGDDEGHRLPDEADVTLGEDPVHRRTARRPDEVDPVLVDRRVHVAPGEDCHDALHGVGRLDVDGDERAACHVAAGEGDVEHAGHDHVVDVRASARDEASILAPRNALADEPGCGRGRRRHGATSAAAASLTAFTMPW